MSQPIERESMEVDVLFIGAGPATLASAIHLMNQVESFNKAAEASCNPPIEPPSVLVLEKSAGVGDHMLSGAVMNPKACAKSLNFNSRCNLPSTSSQPGVVSSFDRISSSANFRAFSIRFPFRPLPAHSTSKVFAVFGPISMEACRRLHGIVYS